MDFLSDGDIEMSLITFHGFIHGDEVVLARQIEVPQKQATESAKASKATNLQKLLKKIKTSGVEPYFDDAAELIRATMSGYEWPNQSGYTYYFQDTTESGTSSNRAYLSLSVPDGVKGSIVLTLQERAIKASGTSMGCHFPSLGDKSAPAKGIRRSKNRFRCRLEGPRS